MNVTRQQIVTEALSWLNTPYHHEGDVKGAGVDCAMLPVRVYCDTGKLPHFDPRPYSQQWHLHRSEEKYLAWIKTYAVEIQAADVGLGDLILFKYGRTISHSGIVVKLNPLVFIHSFIGEGCVLAGLNERDYTERVDSYWSAFA